MSMRIRILVATLASLCAAFATLSVALTDSAVGYDVDWCPAIPQYHGSGIPAGSGIPPWGFHTGQPISGATGSYARGWGDQNLGTGFISGQVCQTDRVRGEASDRSIVVKVLSPMAYHSHTAYMWGYEGNLIKVRIKVTSSTDSRCQIGTKGRMVMYASYNGVRSDSVQFIFPAACRDHNHLYHGPQVNAQVPPL